MAEAALWYRRAAKLGNAAAYYKLGTMHLNGTGVEKSSQQAAQFFEMAISISPSEVNFGSGAFGEFIGQTSVVTISGTQKAKLLDAKSTYEMSVDVTEAESDDNSSKFWVTVTNLKPTYPLGPQNGSIQLFFEIDGQEVKKEQKFRSNFKSKLKN